uniref:G-protein coupled receptors family 1 profile domain-containing protein n=1 Tax=Biomphalaria glabrata TaxID=6526 RepID=A0A2C9M0Y2_BIOGL
MNNTRNEISNLNHNISMDSSDVTEEVYFIILIVANVVIANILSLLGIMGSILNIIILSYHKMQDTTNVVLLAISVCDLIYSLTQLSLNFSLSSFLINFYWAQWASVIHALCIDQINYLAVLTSIHLVTLVSIERMVAVCFPFHVARFLTISRVKIIIISMVFCNILLICPEFMKAKLFYSEYNNVTLPALKYQDFF